MLLDKERKVKVVITDHDVSCGYVVDFTKKGVRVSWCKNIAEQTAYDLKVPNDWGTPELIEHTLVKTFGEERAVYLLQTFNVFCDELASLIQYYTIS